MKYFFTFILLLTAFTVRSQVPISLSGFVVDETNNSPVELAAVVLKSKDSVYVANVLTDDKGKFYFPKVSASNYFIEVSFVGYEKFFSPSFNVAASKALDIFKLKKSNTNLKEVNVTAVKNAIEFKPGKTVYNVGKDPTNTGLDGLEVLRKIPGVFIDNNDNITVRGKSGIRVYIDDRPSALAAESPADAIKFFPAGSIESIEVITNPGAKYDAAGSGAIINIKLKKEKKMGMNGTVNVNTGTRYEFSGINKYNGGLNANIRRNKTNVFINSGYQFGERKMYNENNRESGAGLILKTAVNGINGSQNIFAKAGVDYFINDRNTFGISYMISSGNYHGKSNSLSTNNYHSPFIPDSSFSNARSNNDMVSHTFNLNHILKTKHAGEEFSIDITHNIVQHKNLDSITSGLEATGSSVFNQNQYSNLKGGAVSNISQIDYSRSLSGNGKLEAGIKNSYASNKSDFNFFNNIQSAWQFDSARSNRFDYYENVSAAYFQYSNKFEKWEYQLGLRGEYTKVNSNLTDVKQSYPNLFPDIQANKKFEDNFEISISYSKRIDRVPFNMLSNAVSYSDRFNGTRGNPKLLPAISNGLSIDLQKQFDGSKEFKINGAGLSVYGSITKNSTAYQVVVDTSKISYVTYINVPQTINAGADVYAQLAYKRWWSGMLNLSTNYNYFNAKANGMIYQVYGQSTFKFLKKHSININGFYFSRFLTPQGYVKGNYQISLAYKFIFLKDNGSLSLNISDIFKTGRMHYYVNSDAYKLNGIFQMETRVAFLSFQYKFSKGWQGDGKKRTKKNTKDSRLEFNDNGGGLGTGK